MAGNPPILLRMMMKPMSHVRAVFGPIHYRPTTAWGPIRALVAMEVVAALAAFVAMALWFGSFLAGYTTTTSGPCLPISPTDKTCSTTFTISPKLPALAALLLFDVLVVAAAWRLAKRGGMRATDVLALRAPLGGIRAAIAVGAVMAAALALEMAAAPYYAAASASATRLIAELVRQGGWALAVLTVGIAAPVAEEVWLRGFLMSALAKSRLGFWPAGLLTALLFAVLHAAQYALILLVPIFVLGLVLTWALGLTGSLWVPIALHMGNNLIGLFLLWVWPPL
jgi:uncharacterized protein